MTITKKRLYYTDKTTGLKVPIPMYNVNDVAVSECKRDIQLLNKEASQLEKGLMSTSDKKKLDSLDPSTVDNALKTANSASTVATTTSNQTTQAINNINTKVNDINNLLTKITVTSAASDASQIVYTTSASTIQSSTVQGALDEICPDSGFTKSGHSAESVAVGNIQDVIAESLNSIRSLLESLLDKINKGFLGDISPSNINIIGDGGISINGAANELYFSGSCPHNPFRIGQEYFNAANKVWYKAVSTDSGGWKQITNG